MANYACDIETTGLDFTTDTILGLGYWSPAEHGFITDITAMKEWLEAHKQDSLIWCNGKFDQKFLYRYTGVWPQNSLDVQLATSVLPNRPDKLKLGVLVEHFLGIPSYKEKNFVKNLADEDIADVAAYCLTDCEYTYKVCEKLIPELVACGNYEYFLKYMMKSADRLARAEYRGVRVDKDMLQKVWEAKVKDVDKFDKLLREKYKELVSKFETQKLKEYKEAHPNTRKKDEQLLEHKSIKFNFNSAKQRKWLLIDQLGFKCEVKKYKAGKPTLVVSTKAEVIEDYVGKHPIIEDLLTYAKICKQEQDTYKVIDFIGADGKIHASFNLDVTRTGRLSCSSPNLQQVPKNED